MADEAFKATIYLPPKSIEEKALAIEAYGRYAAATENSRQRRESLSSIKELAHQIVKSNPKTIRQMGLSVYGLIDAYRLSGLYDFLNRALEIFDRDMEALWDEKAGVYATSPGTKRYIYTPFDVGAVLAGLNSILWFTLPSYDKPFNSGPDLAKKRYVRFFENAVVISGMQEASGVALVEHIYLESEPSINFTHPALPLPEKAGGRFGTAPVYASEVTYENRDWKVTNRRFRTRDAMFLAIISVLLNRSQIDCFVSIERLTHKLMSGAGIQTK